LTSKIEREFDIYYMSVWILTTYEKRSLYGYVVKETAKLKGKNHRDNEITCRQDGIKYKITCHVSYRLCGM